MSSEHDGTYPQAHADAIKYEQLFTRQLLIALAVGHDLQTFLSRSGITDARVGLVRAAVVLLEIAQDYQCACDFDETTTAQTVIEWLLGKTLTRDPNG